MPASTKEQLLITRGEFTWNYGSTFFIQTKEGNYVWRAKSYNGDGTVRPFAGSYADWCKHESIPFGRDKGLHEIADYIDEDFEYLPEMVVTPQNKAA